MRDPERIDEVLTKIRLIWKRFPDLRLMQDLTKALLKFYLENINE